MQIGASPEEMSLLIRLVSEALAREPPEEERRLLEAMMEDILIAKRSADAYARLRAHLPTRTRGGE